MPGAKLRVLYDTTLTANPAGSGTFARGVLAGLQAQERVEVLTTALAAPAIAILDARRKATAGRLRQALRHLIYYSMVLPRQAAAVKADVVFCPGSLVPLRGRVPLTMTIFDLTVLRYPETQDALSRRYAELMLARGARRARTLCTISQAVADELRRIYPTRGRIFVAYPGPNPELVHARPEPVPLRAPRFLLMVGTLEPRKNHVTALRALAAFRDAHPERDLRLVLAGSAGWRYDSLLTLIRQLGLSDQVVRLGAVTAGQLRWLYQHADGLLFPSLYEGFGLPILEAFLFGCPVAAADIPTVREIAQGDTTLLIPRTSVEGWREAIETLSGSAFDPAMRDRARQRAAFFTWDRCTDAVTAALLAAAGRQ